ncbi:MAG: flippase-like domain-containing protein [Chloroflexota bacterium]|nr:flippase-like domain-containing protein [Chloroflexota bacterium]
MSRQPTQPADPADQAEEPVVDYPLVNEEGADAPAPLSQRLRDPRTIISIVLPLILIVLVAVTVGNLNLSEMVGSITRADALLLVTGFGVYYLGFPLRGLRWALLLRGAGMRVSLRDSTEIIFIGWLVNCLVPAKLGDVYRAYLLRLNFDVSLSRTFGTVFIERVFDLFTIVLLGLAAGLWSFRDGLSTEVAIVFGVGLVFIGLLAVGLFVIRNFGRRLLSRLPVPHRVVEFYDRFEEGVFSIERRRVPLLAIVTVLIWATEATRLYLVVLALGFEFPLGISGAFFVALIASLLTAIPFTPAGLGIVEAGVVGILTAFYGATLEQAGAIALVDRAISVVSIIILGSIVYLLSSKTRGGQPRGTQGLGDTPGRPAG